MRVVWWDGLCLRCDGEIKAFSPRYTFWHRCAHGQYLYSIYNLEHLYKTYTFSGNMRSLAVLACFTPVSLSPFAALRAYGKERTK